MPSLKEIKSRIASVQSTQKITSAMRMVASAKLHKTQGMTERFLRYRDELRGIVDALGADEECGFEGKAGNIENLDKIDVNDNINVIADIANTPSAPILLIPISSNSGLCGAFNSNIAKATFRRIAELKAQGVETRLLPIGKKIAHELRKANLDIIPDYTDLTEKMERGDAYPLVAGLVNFARRLFDNGDIGGVEIIFHHFKSMGSQIITTTSLSLQPGYGQRTKLAENYKRSENSEHSERNKSPEPSESFGSSAASGRYLTEPSRGELLRSLHPRLLNAELYGTLLDSLTSEHAVRMLAMQTADDNANDLLRELTLTYNKSRQQAITNELIDIMSGKTG